jgi:hypothetical protein
MRVTNRSCRQQEGSRELLLLLLLLLFKKELFSHAQTGA